MILRTAGLDDVPDLVRIAAEAFGPYVERIGRPPAPMCADFNALVARGVVHVAELESVDGYVVCYPRSDHMQLENIAVAPAHQGKGLGRALIGLVERKAHEANLPAVELHTNAAMRENLVLYPHLGYVQIGRHRADGFDRIYFRKDLGQVR